jgi:hypothetical protein
VPIFSALGASAYWNPQFLSRPVAGFAKNMSKMLTFVMAFVAFLLIQCIALILTCACPDLRTNVLTKIIVFVSFLIWRMRY